MMNTMRIKKVTCAFRVLVRWAIEKSLPGVASNHLSVATTAPQRRRTG